MRSSPPLLVLAIIAACSVVALASAFAPAWAQGPAMEFLMDQMRQRDDERRRALQRQRQEMNQRARRAEQEQQRRAAQRAADAISDASPRVVELPKDPNARVLLVLGDQMAEGLAQGLQEAFAGEPMVVVRAVTRAESGLARREPVDWVAYAPEALGDTSPLAIVVALGVNDGVLIADGAASVEPRTDRWRELYQARVDQLLTVLAERRVPVYWAGLPAMRQPNVAAEASFLNDIFKSRTFNANVRFVDVWEGFVDEEGRYVAIGPDVNGQTRRLRRPDGVGLTPAGNRKFAFYVENEIRRDITITGPTIAALPPSTEEIVPARPAPTMPGVTAPPPPYVGPVIQVTPILAARGGELATVARRSRPADDVATRVFVVGDMPASPPGRADNFRWPRDSGGASTTTAAPPGPRAEARGDRLQ